MLGCPVCQCVSLVLVSTKKSLKEFYTRLDFSLSYVYLVLSFETDAKKTYLESVYETFFYSSKNEMFDRVRMNG
jgi:hypothetical protein